MKNKKFYKIMRKAISKDLAKFCSDYLIMKSQVLRTFLKEKWIPERNVIHGVFNDPQAPGAFSIYGDQAMETLLCKVKPKMEKILNTKLVETYAYARVYYKGNDLKKHRDRMSCELSTTLNLGGDPWPIYIEPKIKVDLEPGDMLVYTGCTLTHWREPFEGEYCAQTFLHFNQKTEENLKNIYDERLHLGLPSVRILNTKK